MVDTHAHLGLCEPSADDLLAAARAAGLTRVLTVGLDERTNAEAIAHAEDHEGVFACVGRHPNSATGFDDAAANALEALGPDPRVAAIGETGLDYYRDGASREDQRRAFAAQIEIARRAAKPVVIHVRNGEGEEGDAVAEVFATLAEQAAGVEVILHCFSAPPERVSEAAERGWYCSFAGNVTYPKAEKLREAAGLVPEELILAETDSPFLAPQPVRGKPNQPANVVATAEVLAEVRGVPYAQLEQTIEANARRALAW
jgi:TatD DNase family protein